MGPGSNPIKTRCRAFFDRQAVIDAVGRANAAALSKAGAYIRRTAKGSIRKAKGPAKPGNPPHSHVGTLKELIYFSFDEQTRSVVVGPTPLRGAAVVPRVLELGGQSGARVNARRKHRTVGGAGEIRTGGRACRSTKQAKNTRFGTVQVTYIRLRTQAQADRANQINEDLYGPMILGPAPIAARPYMGPALVKELPKLPPLWANAVS